MATAIGITRLRGLYGAAMLAALFSLVIACLFVLLDAVDVAFTEAAVGAGISTVLMLTVLALTRSREAVTPRRRLWPAGIGSVLAGGMLIYASQDLPAFGRLAAMAFTVLMRTGLYPPELHSVNLDADVVYRRLLPTIWMRGQHGGAQLRDRLGPHVEAGLAGVATLVTRPLRADGELGAPWSTSGMVRWVVLLLGILLLISYL